MTTINLFVFPGPPPPAPDMETLSGINHKLETLMTTVNDLFAEIQTIKAQQEKARAEIVGKIGTLESALSALELPADAAAALAELKASTQALDDIVPDAPPVA